MLKKCPDYDIFIITKQWFLAMWKSFLFILWGNTADNTVMYNNTIGYGWVKWLPLVEIFFTFSYFLYCIGNA